MNNFFNHIQPLFSGKKSRKIVFFCILLTLLFFASCSNHHCKEPMYVPLVISFYSDIDTSKQVTFKYLEIKGVGSDSIINISGNYTLLPLRKFENSSNFVFISGYDTGEEIRTFFDTLTIKHTNTQEFVSAECGCLTTFRLDEVRHTRRNITDAIIVKQSVTSSIANSNESHIKIYFENY